jgi:hypothetical protein
MFSQRPEIFKFFVGSYNVDASATEQQGGVVDAMEAFGLREEDLPRAVLHLTETDTKVGGKGGAVDRRVVLWIEVQQIAYGFSWSWCLSTTSRRNRPTVQVAHSNRPSASGAQLEHTPVAFTFVSDVAIHNLFHLSQYVMGDVPHTTKPMVEFWRDALAGKVPAYTGGNDEDEEQEQEL